MREYTHAVDRLAFDPAAAQQGGGQRDDVVFAPVGVTAHSWGAWVTPGATVEDWVERAKGQRLDRVDWSNRSRAPKRTRRTNATIEQQVLTIREWLKDHSILGEYGAAAIRRD